MLLKSDLKRIAHERLLDAEALHKAGRFDGATYLCGYVIEISLKLRICKTLRWDGFPERNTEFQGMISFKTHNLDILLRLSGIEKKVKDDFFTEWSVVKIWSPEDRYRPIGTITDTDAENFLEATKTLLKLL